MHACDQRAERDSSTVSGRAHFPRGIMGRGRGAFLQPRSPGKTSEGETGFITSKICLSKPGHSDYGLKSLSCLVRQSLVTLRTKTFSYLELADHTELIRFAFLF